MCVCGTTRPALVFGEGAMKRKDVLCWLRGCKIKELCTSDFKRLKCNIYFFYRVTRPFKKGIHFLVDKIY